MSATVMPAVGFDFSFSFNELKRRLQPISTETRLSTSRGNRSVCRNLFGPINHEENAKFVHKQLNEIAKRDMSRWNFNFEQDVPLQKPGLCAWEPIPVQEVPVAYEMPHLMSRLSQMGTEPRSVKPQSPSSVHFKPIQADISPVKDSLQTSITAITTASTTITTLPKPIPKMATPSVETSSSPTTVENKSTSEILVKKQTFITDFLRVRKRDHSAMSSSDKTSSEEEEVSPQQTKRARLQIPTSTNSTPIHS